MPDREYREIEEKTEPHLLSIFNFCDCFIIFEDILIH